MTMQSHPPSPRLLLTGASGFLGQALRERLAGDYEVIGVGHAHAVPPLRAVDLRDEAALVRLVEEVQPRVVVHSAAYREPDFCEQHRDDTFALNARPVEWFCRLLPAGCPLVLMSTDYVFDGEHAPYHEADERRPINVYGRSKVAAEDAALTRSDAIVLRVPLLMGRGGDFNASGFIAKMITVLREVSASEWDDRVMRYPTHIEDVAEVVAFLLKERQAGVFHFSGPRGQTQYGWARELAIMLNRNADLLRPVVVSRPAARPADSHLAMDRLQSLRCIPQTDFRQVAEAILKQCV